MASPSAQAPTIHEAALAPGASGLVEWGKELTQAEASDRRKQGLDVVVRGPDRVKNRQIAEAVELAVGPYQVDPPHVSAGPLSLPHCQQLNQPPFGHCFYETDKRKAKKK